MDHNLKPKGYTEPLRFKYVIDRSRITRSYATLATKVDANVNAPTHRYINDYAAQEKPIMGNQQLSKT